MIREKLQKVQEVKYMLRDAKKDITDSVQVIVRVIKKKQRDVFLRNKSAHYSEVGGDGAALTHQTTDSMTS